MAAVLRRPHHAPTAGSTSARRHRLPMTNDMYLSYIRLRPIYSHKFGIALAYSYIWLRPIYSRSAIPNKFGIALAYSYICNPKYLFDA